MFQDVIDYFKQAHETGDLNKEQSLILALQYENKLGTQNFYPLICEILKKNVDCKQISKDEATPIDFRGTLILRDCSPLLSLVNYSGIVGHIEPFQAFADRYGMKPDQIVTLAALGKTGKNRKNRLKLIQSAWIQYQAFKNTDWIWIFAKEKNKIDTKAIIQKLGLYHYREQKKDTQFLQFQFKAKECYKPSWVNANLSFYFDSAPNFSDFGLSRDLATGQIGFKEWLTPVNQIELWDVNVLSLEENTNFDELTNEFKIANSKRIWDKRK